MEINSFYLQDKNREEYIMAAPQCPNAVEKAKWEAKKKAAIEERDRCNEAIPYFEEWKGLASSCREALIGMRNKNYNIAGQCEQIKINGDRIDNGRYYTEGRNATYFTGQLSSMISGLYNLINEMVRVIDLLKESREQAVKDITEANKKIKLYSKPCGVCIVCNPEAYETNPSSTTTTPASTPTSRRPVNGSSGPQMMTV